MKRNQRILLVGDLRPAYNFGAIATTETLIERLREGFPESEIRMIDHRSFLNESPEEGLIPWSWPEKDPDYFTRSPIRPAPHMRILGVAKRIIKKLLPGANQHYQKPIKFEEHLKGHVPNQWNEFENFTEQFQQNKVLRYERNLLEWADLVVINSEGNMVNGTDQWGRYRVGGRYVMAVSYLSKVVMGKTTAIVNFTCDPGNSEATEIIRNVFPLLDLVLPREPLSLALLEKLGISCPHGWIPDILFSYPREQIRNPFSSARLKKIELPKTPFICLGDSSGMRSLAGVAKWDVELVFGEIVRRIRTELNYEVVIVDGFCGTHQQLNNLIRREKICHLSLLNCDYRDLINVLSKSALFVSGRWHASIMGAISGTPFILWGSDSHKTRSMYSMFDYEVKFYDVDTLPLHLDSLLNDCRKILSSGPEMRSDIEFRSTQLGVQSLQMIKLIEEAS